MMRALFFLAATIGLVSTAMPVPAVSQHYPGFTKTDMSRVDVDRSEILQGCPYKDCIPAVDNPTYVPASDITLVGDMEPVIRLQIGQDIRAYPLRALMFHEIVNDTVGGVPVTVTFCPLCNSAIVFDRRMGGAILDFGVSGLLRNSDLIMYDRQTESLWQQFEGRGIIGQYAGEKLTMVPSRLEAFAMFQAANPDGQVFVPGSEKRLARYYNPYEKYDSAPAPFLYRGPLPNGIEALARVVMVRGQEHKAVALDHLSKTTPKTLGDVTLTWTAGQASALDTRSVADGKDVGNVRVTDSAGNDIVHDIVFAFVYHAFYPDGEIIQ